ncbi:MAG: RluA family pseudouridine synthase [Verrucomicrobiota bacterium]
MHRPEKPLTFPVDREITLMKFLLEKSDTRKKVKSWLKHKSVRVNGEAITQFDYLLNLGDVVVITQDRFATPDTELPSGIQILHEDEAIIVIDKPPGLLSIATDAEKEKTAYFKINNYLTRREPFKESRIFIVHRLDRGTSGILVFVKKESYKTTLQKNWHLANKRYEAVVEGKMNPPKGEIRTYLIEGDQYKMRSTPNRLEGQLAITGYKTLETNGKFSLLEIDLLTGRKNQIRVHLAEQGKPIVGDEKYGSTINPIRRMALHASYLEFVHPVTGQILSFTRPAPSTFRSLVQGQLPDYLKKLEEETLKRANEKRSIEQQREAKHGSSRQPAKDRRKPRS